MNKLRHWNVSTQRLEGVSHVDLGETVRTAVVHVRRERARTTSEMTKISHELHLLGLNGWASWAILEPGLGTHS